MVKDGFKVEFEMEQHMCNNCKKSNPEYYELKVQLRYTFFDDIEEIKTKTIKVIANNFDTVNKLEEIDNGFDIYFRNKHELNKISSLYNKNFLVDEKRTKKIMGRDKLTMKDIWRYVLLINFINLERGDKISLKGEEYYIKAINNHDLVLREINNGNKKIISYYLAKDYLKLIKKNVINWKTNTINK